MRTALSAVLARVWASVDARVTPRVYAVLRIGTALLVLARSTDWLRPVVTLDHHAWLRGVEHAPWSEASSAPMLATPLLPGLGALVTVPWLGNTFAVARTTAAFTLLFGVGSRSSALIVGLTGYALMAADAFRYLHHLHVLYLSCLLLALMPSGRWLALDLWISRRARADVPKWPLQLWRVHVLLVYAASGAAKLRSDWLDGSLLTLHVDTGLIDRTLWAASTRVITPSQIAIGLALLELALVPLLAFRRTRWLGIGLALSFHALSAHAMMVSTFPMQMALALVAFLPWRESSSQPSELPRRDTFATRRVPCVRRVDPRRVAPSAASAATNEKPR